MLGQDTLFPQTTEDEDKLCNFMAMALERIWLERNKIWRVSQKPNWQEVSKYVNTGYFLYWPVSITRNIKCKSHNSRSE